MESERLRKAVDAALVPVVASLGAWGVRDAHWLPDRDGYPVVWLRTRARTEADALRGQTFLLPQLQVTLSRLEVPHSMLKRLRIEVTSLADEDRLFGE